MKINYNNTHSLHLSNFMGALKVAQQNKQIKFSYYPCSKYILANIQLLVSEGYIYSFSLVKQQTSFHVTVWLRYTASGAPLVNNIIFFDKPSRKFSITFSALRKLVFNHGPSCCYVLSTALGIKTSTYCLQNKISGNLLYRLIV